MGVQRYKLSGPIELEPHSRVEIYSSAGTETAVLAAQSMRSALRPFLSDANDAIRDRQRVRGETESRAD